MKKKKQRGSLERVTGTIFILVLFVFLLINIIVPDKEKSVQENRMLASAPKWNWGNVISGDYMEKFERYMSDQFVGRDFWRTIKVGVDRLAGVSKEHGVYIGKDGQLLEEIELPNQEYLADNLKSIQNFAETNTDLPVRMMLVPDAAGVLGAKLPAMAEVENQTQLISMVKKELGSSVEWIDAASALNKHRNEKIYYKTDHHWTSLGAFYAFQEAAPSLGIEGDISGKYVSYAVSNDFNGMLASKSGVYLSEKEQVDIYVPSDSDTDVIVDYVDEGKRTTSLFDSSKLDTPGILWPKFEDQAVGLKLAFIGSIKDEILQTEELASELVDFINRSYPGVLEEKYAIEHSDDKFEVLEKIAQSRHCLVRGNEFDTEKAAAILLDDFRNGRLGRITLEVPEAV